MAETVPKTDNLKEPKEAVDTEEGWNQVVDAKKVKGEKRIALAKDEKANKKALFKGLNLNSHSLFKTSHTQTHYS